MNLRHMMFCRNEVYFALFSIGAHGTGMTPPMVQLGLIKFHWVLLRLSKCSATPAGECRTNKNCQTFIKQPDQSLSDPVLLHVSVA